MALTFNGSSQYIEHGAALVSDAPLTLFVSTYIAVAASACSGVFVYGTTDTSRLQLGYFGFGSIGWRARFAKHGASAESYRQVGATASTGWNMVAASWSSYGSPPSLYVNGSAVTGVSDSGSGGTMSVTKTGLGREVVNGVSLYYGGTCAEAAIWNAELDAGEMKALTVGYSPEDIRPQSRVGYWPLGGHYGRNAKDRWKNKYDMTETGSPTYTDHCRVIYPVLPDLRSKGVAPPSTKYWLFGGKSARLIGGGLGG